MSMILCNAIALLFSESNQKNTRYALAVRSPILFPRLINEASHFGLPNLGWKQKNSMDISGLIMCLVSGGI
jgi:hypothetical protein